MQLLNKEVSFSEANRTIPSRRFLNIYPLVLRNLPGVIAIVFLLLMGFAMSLYWPYPETVRSVTGFGLNESPRRLLSMLYPAIFFAAGRGMGTSDSEKIPGLEQFVFGNGDSFDIANIPDETIIEPLSTPFELTHLYLLYAVGWCWRFLGVSLASLHIFAALLCGLVASMLYAIFRVGLSRVVSVLGVLAVCSSPIMMSSTLDLRDYTKTPFYLACFAILLTLAVRSISGRRLLLLSVLSGVVLGIGVGMRTDLMICVFPVFLFIVFFARIDSNRPFLVRCTGGGAFIMVLMLIARPVLGGMAADAGQQLTHHSYFMGLSVNYEKTMGFDDASYTDFSFPDEVIIGMVNRYARYRGDYNSMVNPYSSEYKRVNGDLNAPPTVDPLLYFRGPEYGHFGRKLMLEYIKVFPADLIARAWCALVATLKMQETVNSYGCLQNMSHLQGLAYLLYLQEKLAVHLGYYGLFYTVLVLLCVSAGNLRLALCLTFLLAWFGGSTSLSFQYRHVFHLSFIPLFSCLFLFEAVVRFLWKLHKGEFRKSLWKDFGKEGAWSKPLNRMAVYLLLVSVAIVLPVFFLRIYQEDNVRDFAEHLSEESLVPVETTVSSEQGNLLVAPDRGMLPGLKEQPHGEAAWEYLAVALKPKGQDIPLDVVYNDEDKDSLTIYGSDLAENETVMFFFPVYETGMFPHRQMVEDLLKMIFGLETIEEHAQEKEALVQQILSHRRELVGISLPEAFADAYTGFYRVIDANDLAILPFIQVPKDLRHIRSFKKCKYENCILNLI